MSKVIIFLADGMADEPLEELGGKTPLEAVDTPAMDSIAERGVSGTFQSLLEGFPTSSDVANMSVLGYNPEKYYTGRGPLEAAAQGIELAPDDVAWRCNLITAENNILTDYSAGHIDNIDSKVLINDLQKEFGNDKVSFHPGVSYRNLLILHGSEFSERILYKKPDSSQGMNIDELSLVPMDSEDSRANYTVEFIADLQNITSTFLKAHPLNAKYANKANMIWPWSPGKRSVFPPFREKYGRQGAVITAVDVITGIAKYAEMDVLNVPGATGFIDTNYQGKAEAAVRGLEDHDFIYLHVEAIDECSHMGNLQLKMRAIKEFDSQIVAPVLSALEGRDVRFAVLPDHPVPVKLRKHTRTPVPLTLCGPGIEPDNIHSYSETSALQGKLGLLKEDELMKLLFS